MATADQIERIVLELEEQGAGKAYVGIKRLDDTLKDLQRREGPAGVAEAFVALDAALSNSLVELPNMAALVQQNERAFAGLVAQIRRYEEAQAKKHERNQALLQAKADAEAAEKAYAQALAKQEEFNRNQRKASEYAASVDKKIEANKFTAKAQADEKKYQAALKAQDEHSRRMRAGETPFQAKAQAPKKPSGGQKLYQFVAKNFGRGGTDALENVGGMLEKLGPIAAKIGPPLASAAAAVGAVGIAAAGAAAYGASKFSSAVISAQAYREDVLEAFKTIRRTQGDADAILRLANETSDKLGVNRAQGAGQFLDLLSKGFSPEKTREIVSSLADLSTVDPSARIDDLARIIGKIKAMNKLSQDSITELSTAGLEAGDVYAGLEKQLGKSRGDILKMLSSGKVDASGLDSVMAAISGQVGGGPAGAAAAAKAQRNLSSLLRRVEDIPGNILFDVAVGPGIDDVKGFLRTVLDYFDSTSTSGKEVRKVTGDLFNALIEGLTGNKVDTAKGITGTLDAIVAGAREAVPMVRETASAIRDIGTVAGTLTSVGTTVSSFLGIGKDIPLIDVLDYLMSSIPLIGPLVAGPVKSVKLLSAAWSAINGDIDGAAKKLKSFTSAGMLSNLGEGMAKRFFPDVAASIQATVESLKQQGAQFYASALTLGTNLWQGLVQGITGGIEFVRQGATSLANAALGAVGSTWKVGSPAKAFEELSLWGGAGAERGFYKSASGVEAAAGYMAQAAIGGAAMTPANGNGLAVATGGQAGIVLHFSPTIVVQGASSPVQAHAVGAAAVRGARAEWEAQLGGTLRRLRYG